MVTPPPCNDELDCNSPNGTCDFWGDCVCSPGFNGADCACSDVDTCNDLGYCSGAGNCVCDPGFGGADCACEDAIACSGNGECNFAGDCVCDPGYVGPDCATPTCIPEVNCNSHGQCVAGDCVCDAGYAGGDCGTPICDPEVDCNGVPVGIADFHTRILFTPTVATVEGSTIAWQDKEFLVFDPAWTLNLGLIAGINPMTVPPGGGEVLGALPPTTPASGAFEATYFSSSVGALEFYVTGDYICPDNAEVCGPQPGEPWYAPFDGTFVTNVATLSGAFVDAGPGTLPTTLGGVPVTYAMDGALVCLSHIVGTTECDGTSFLSAFKGASTPLGGPPAGVNVAIHQVFVDPTDPSGQTLIPVNLTITYDEVTGNGYTTVVTSSQGAGSISSSFSLDALGFTPVFFDVTTTAQANGDITVCSDYPGTFANECDLRLLHNDDAVPDEFVDATLSEAHENCPFPDLETTCGNHLCINTVTNQICAGATSLSPWVLAEYVGNQAPIADAGLDQAIIAVGTIVHLDGTASYDLDGDSFTYLWTLSTPSGSATALDNSASATPSFVPDLYGDYQAALVVTDSKGLPSAPDNVLVSFDNLAPVADAGPNQGVRVGDVVLLEGSGTDANGDSLTYEWSIVSQPVGSNAALDDPTSQMPTFTPDLPGTYEVHLIVSDGLLDSDIASVSIVATTAEGELIDTLENAIDVVNGLDPAAFKNRILQKNMAKHIGQALADVDKGKFGAAREKLEAVLQKTDGCATDGSPDPNDWIEDCAAQAEVYPLIVDAIALVDEILGN